MRIGDVVEIGDREPPRVDLPLTVPVEDQPNRPVPERELEEETVE